MLLSSAISHFNPNISSHLKSILYESSPTSLRINNHLLQKLVSKLDSKQLSKKTQQKELKFTLKYLKARLNNTYLSPPLLELTCLTSNSSSSECRFINLIHLLDYYADSMLLKPQSDIKYFSIDTLLLTIKYLLNECSVRLDEHCEGLADKLMEVLVQIFYLNEATRHDGFFIDLVALMLEFQIKWLLRSDRNLHEADLGSVYGFKRLNVFLKDNLKTKFEIFSARATQPTLLKLPISS